MSRIILAAGVKVREVWAWAMSDFANSALTTTVVTAIFNAHFVVVVAGGAPWATLAIRIDEKRGREAAVTN